MGADAGKFQITGSSLVGRGLSFEVGALVESAAIVGSSPIAVAIACTSRKQALVDIADAIYREGRSSVLLSYDDRFALHNAVETLRGLAVIVGPIAGDRHRRASDIIARLLQEQEA